MKKIINTILIASLCVVSSCTPAREINTTLNPAKKTTLDQTHTAFTSILKTHLKNNKVDYAGLKKNSTALNNYLDTLASVSQPEFNRWNRNQQMSFLINLYNATTLKLVIDHYRVKSIKDIGNVIQGPWKQKVVRIFGEEQTLDYLEHVVLREKYKDPRIHFAVNCASIGCPSLRSEAFHGDQLDTQLNEQARAFLIDKSKNRIDSKHKTLYLSKIFDWFKDDFTAKSGTVENFITKYVSPADSSLIKQGGFSIEYLDYDWNLNKQ